MPRRKAGCSRASTFGKLGAQRAPNLCVVQMRCRVSGDLPIQASGGLRGFPGEVAHQDDGCLGPGAGGFGAEGSFGYAPDEALGYGPCHGGLGIMAEFPGIQIGRQVRLIGDVLALELGVAVEDCRELLPSHRAVGAEPLWGNALHQAGFLGPCHGLGVVPALFHILEAAAGGLRSACQAVEHGDQLAPGEGGLRGEGVGAGSAEEALLDGSDDLLLGPVICNVRILPGNALPLRVPDGDIQGLGVWSEATGNAGGRVGGKLIKGNQ